MPTAQKYVGKGKYVPFPTKKAQKGHPKAQPVKKQLPLQSPQIAPTPERKHIYNTRWQNAPLEALGDLLAAKATFPGARLRLRGGRIIVRGEKAHCPSVLMVRILPDGKEGQGHD